MKHLKLLTTDFFFSQQGCERGFYATETVAQPCRIMCWQEI